MQEFKNGQKKIIIFKKKLKNALKEKTLSQVFFSFLFFVLINTQKKAVTRIKIVRIPKKKISGYG
jgi:hypothetical protein